jgi:hypothetical protein
MQFQQQLLAVDPFQEMLHGRVPQSGRLSIRQLVVA